MKSIRLLFLTSLLTLSTQVMAGEAGGMEVTVNEVEQSAMGSLYDARFSTDASMRIGCAVAVGNERGYFGYCEATDGGVSVDCFTYDQKMIDTIASINTFSFVYFTWEQQNRKGFDDNVCTNVTVATRSIQIPEILAPSQP